MPAQLTFLGSSDSQGVPRWWCGCSVCKEARTTGQNARSRPSIVLKNENEQILVDAAPELRMQMTRANIKNVDAVLITHAHNDHCLGLGDIGDQARWTGRPSPIYAPADVLPTLKEKFAYMTRGAYTRLTPFLNLESAQQTFAGFTISAHKVPHGANGYAYGFRFGSSKRAWAYVPDSIGITNLEPWQNLELLILGTSFYKEDAAYERRSVYDVMEALELIKHLKPKRVIFTHLGHGIDIRKAAPEGTRYAAEGLCIDV